MAVVNSKEVALKAVDEALFTHVGAAIPYGALSSVPLGICALAQVMLTASTVPDMSINNPPIGGFKYIKYPNSLRTTLLQISHLGYEALHSGHLGMGMIHGYSKQIKAAAMEAARTMQKATPVNQAEVDGIVGKRLENIKVATEKCQNESDKVVAALEKLLVLMEETSEACSNSMKASEDQLKENQKREKECQERKKAAEIEKLQQEKDKAEYELLLKKTQEELHAALGAVPKGLPLLGLEALSMIRKLFSKTGKSEAAELMKARMEIAKQANLEAEEKIKKAKEEMKATDNKFLDAVIQLSQLDLNRVSYQDAVQILKQAVEFISNLLTHWRKLQEFCKSLNQAIQLQLTDGSQKLQRDYQHQLTISDRSLMSEHILELLKTMSQQSYQIGCVGELYVKLSSVYIMPAIGALSENSAVDSGRIEQVRKELTANATKAHKSIVDTIEREKEALLSKVKAEKLKIEELLAICNDSNAICMV